MSDEVLEPIPSSHVAISDTDTPGVQPAPTSKVHGSQELAVFPLTAVLAIATGRFIVRDYKTLETMVEHVTGARYTTLSFARQGMTAARKRMLQQFPWLSEINDLPTEYHPGNFAFAEDWYQSIDTWCSVVAERYLGGGQNTSVLVASGAKAATAEIAN